MSEPVTFTETIRDGVSSIVCDLCGEAVTREQAHARKHGLDAAPDEAAAAGAT